MTGTDVRSPLDAARELAPKIRSCADEIEAERELPRPLFEALADAGLFRLALPRSLGGAELDLPTYIQVIEELGKADASTGWIVNQGGIFATYAARMPLHVARAIWVDTPRAVVANTPAATARAVVVPGGYRVTGRQGFSTGCRHASWVAAHAQVFEDGRLRLEADGQPEARYIFVAVADAELLDTWRVRGMRGTGTHHFAVNDVFVPAERSVLSATAPLRETGPLYRIPRTLLFASGDAAVALGMSRSCLDTFFDLAGVKTPRATPGLLRDQPMVQMHVGQAEAIPPVGPRVPDRDGGRGLGRGDRRDAHARPPRGLAARHDAHDPPGRRGGGHALQCRRGDGDLRGPSAPAAFPGHPRDQPAPAGAPRSLRAGGPSLAGTADRREQALVS